MQTGIPAADLLQPGLPADSPELLKGFLFLRLQIFLQLICLPL